MSRRQNFKKKKMPTWATILISVLTLALVGGAITVASAFGVLHERNENNLLDPDKYVVKSGAIGNGVDLDVQKDGAILIKGDPSESNEVIIQELELEAGTYTISGIEKVDTNNLNLFVRYGDNVAVAGLTSGTFALTETTTVSVVLSFGADVEIHYANKIIRPTLVKGAEAGEFYK